MITTFLFTGPSSDPIGSTTGSHSSSITGSNLKPQHSPRRWAQQTRRTIQSQQHQQMTPLGRTRTEAKAQLHLEPEEQRPLHAENSYLAQLNVTARISNSLVRRTNSNLTWQASFQHHSNLRRSRRPHWIETSTNHRLSGRLHWPHQSRGQQRRVLIPNTTTDDWLHGTRRY